MTFQEMIDKVYIQLRDAPQEFVESGHVEAWLNEAQRDIAQRTKILIKESNIAVAGGLAPLPADFIDSYRLAYGAVVVDTDVSDDDFWMAKDNGIWNGTTLGRFAGSSFELYPAPTDGETVHLRYAYMPPDLVLPAAVTELPLELQDKMVQFALAEALYKEREDQLADRKRQEYEHGLPQRSLAFGRKFTSPNTVRWEPGPWDRDPEARHL